MLYIFYVYVHIFAPSNVMRDLTRYMDELVTYSVEGDHILQDTLCIDEIFTRALTLIHTYEHPFLYKFGYPLSCGTHALKV